MQIRSRWVLALFLSIAIPLVTLFIYKMTQPVPQPITQGDVDKEVARVLASTPPAPSYQSQVYQLLSPSVVSVRTSFVQADGSTGYGLGAGVIVDDNGTILTCLHVVENATSISVVFADGTESTARTVAEQPDNDLALLWPDVIPDNLIPAVLAGSSTLQVGDEVVAIGNPFGNTDSLSSGVVSGLGRTYTSPDTGHTLSDLIQFDAAVNPGSSGGPLVDSSGEVVGIVTALLNPTDQGVFIGIGFAVPINAAASVLGTPWY
jgi:S1-C subfamily serine protease